MQFCEVDVAMPSSHPLTRLRSKIDGKLMDYYYKRWHHDSWSYILKVSKACKPQIISKFTIGKCVNHTQQCPVKIVWPNSGKKPTTFRIHRVCLKIGHPKSWWFIIIFLTEIATLVSVYMFRSKNLRYLVVMIYISPWRSHDVPSISPYHIVFSIFPWYCGRNLAPPWMLESLSIMG